MCVSGEDGDYGKRNVALLHEPVPFSVSFCLSASCSFLLVVQQPSHGQGMEGLQKASNRTAIPNGRLMSEFLCVFQRSDGA